ncbi:thiamine phosphate synthase [Pusillimonas sp.]|uniref:thiamine phosphate synthase n=1 Tax=Pusillimonas sp. TaxID=3040095 RepID=UPI0029A0939C|nr:thiamine phosphate synthase [Pusillimonas sp.]MDX3893772.1 thiamine phosphate synthase [Pusillimonas sp.]
MKNSSCPTRFPRGLYGITPDWHDTDRLLAAVEQAARGGMSALQWRRKTGDPQDRLAQAANLRDLCRALGVAFIVNDSVETALRLDADGVHLGRDDGPLHLARRALGPGRILGASCYNQPELAAQALQDGADYVAFGAVYPSQVKPDAVHATLDHIRAGQRLVMQADGSESPSRAAVVAIGGITAENAGPVVDAGADSLAVISGLFEAPDIRAAAARFSALFNAE